MTASHACLQLEAEGNILRIRHVHPLRSRRWRRRRWRVEPLDSRHSSSRIAPRSVSEKQEDERDWNEAGTTWHRVERSSNFSSRALRFPDAADLSKVEASCEAGVLKVNIMKKESPEGKKQTINVS